jgi:crotonobetainyl-CoA:carnitine CoA-transferase CaiB-like acyl-CoA transferase
MGADVVKIESPDRPDPLRLPGFPGLPKAVDPSGREFSVVFSSYSRSGRTLTLDMKSPAGLETFAQLAAQADVLIDNFATGVMAGWGLTAEALAEMNPRLIWVSVSGYGRTGPRATAMAYGSNINGFMSLTRVWSPHGSQFDYTAVAHVLITVFAALAHRDRTGQGSHRPRRAASCSRRCSSRPWPPARTSGRSRTKFPAPTCPACSPPPARTRGWPSSSRTLRTGTPPRASSARPS